MTMKPMINLTGKRKGEEDFWAMVDDLPKNSFKTLKSLLYFRETPELSKLDGIAESVASLAGDYKEALIGNPFFLCSRLEKALGRRGIHANFILMGISIKVTKEGFKKVTIPLGIIGG